MKPACWEACFLYPSPTVEHSNNCLLLLCRLFLKPSGHYTNLNNRAGLILCGSAPANDANLLFVENRITFFETIASTLNTPYKANLTQGLTAGIAITYMSAPGFGIQLHLSTGAPDNNTGAPKAFMRAYSNYIMGAWH